MKLGERTKKARGGRWKGFVAWRMGCRMRSIHKPLWPSLVGFFVTIAASCGFVISCSDTLWSLGLAVLAIFIAGAALCLQTFTTTVAAAIIGVALSSGALITSLMVTRGFETELIHQMTRLNGHILLTQYGLNFRNDPVLLQEWRNDPRIEAISPFAYSIAAMSVVSTEQPEPAIVMAKALDPEAVQSWRGLSSIFRSQSLKALRPGDVRALPGVAVGSVLSERLGVKIGDQVRLVLPQQLDGNVWALPGSPRYAAFEVLDLIQTGLEDIDDSLVMIHLSAGQSLFFGQARLTGIEFQLREPEQAQVVAAELEASLGTNYRATPWQQQNTGTLTGIRQIQTALSILFVVFEVVAACTLIASLLFIIRKKQAQIAGLMVLGASRRDIFLLFETLGFIVGGIGILGGSLLGGISYLFFHQGKLAFFRDLNPLALMPIDSQGEDWLFCLGTAMGLCLLASGPMALAASRLPILSSLRSYR